MPNFPSVSSTPRSTTPVLPDQAHQDTGLQAKEPESGKSNPGLTQEDRQGLGRRESQNGRARFAKFAPIAEATTKNQKPSVTEKPEGPPRFPDQAEMVHLSSLTGEAFRAESARLIAGHSGISPDFFFMSAEQAKVFVGEMAKNSDGHLQKTNLVPRDLPVTDLVAMVTALQKNHPHAKVDLNFIGRNLNAEEGKALGEMLKTNTNVQKLNLNFAIGETSAGNQAVLEAIPHAKISELELYGRDVTRFVPEVKSAIPHLDMLTISTISQLVDKEALGEIKHVPESLGRIRESYVDKIFNETDQEIYDKSLLPPKDFAVAIENLLKKQNILMLDVFYIGHTLEEAPKEHGTEKMNASLEALKNPEVKNLTQVQVNLWDLERPPSQILDVLKAASRNNPELRLAILLDRTPVGPEGASLIAKELPHIKANTLVLDGTRLGAEGTAAILTAVPNSSVETLNLSNNEFNDAGISALLSSLSKLQKLTLSKTDFTEKSRQDIDASAAKTGCQIVWA